MTAEDKKATQVLSTKPAMVSVRGYGMFEAEQERSSQQAAELEGRPDGAEREVVLANADTAEAKSRIQEATLHSQTQAIILSRHMRALANLNRELLDVHKSYANWHRGIFARVLRRALKKGLAQIIVVKGALVARCRWIRERAEEREGERAIFDQADYRARRGLDQSTELIELDSNGTFDAGAPSGECDAEFLAPYYRSVGLKSPPALTYSALHACGWPMFGTQRELEPAAEKIRASGLFDAASYKSHANCQGLDPVFHYLIVGEQVGIPPSSQFDPAYYGLRYPDVAAARLSPLIHFIDDGRLERRSPVSISSTLDLGTVPRERQRETVLLIVDRAVRTEQTLLAYSLGTRLGRRYDVVALLLEGGELAGAFRRCCAVTVGPLDRDISPVDADYLARRLSRVFGVLFAIAGSGATRTLLKPMAYALVPVLALMHEYNLRREPQGALGRSIEWASEIVVPASSVIASIVEDYPQLANREIQIVVPGAPESPTAELEGSGQPERSARGIDPGGENAFVVLGCGSLDFASGPDLFVSCAAAVEKLGLERPVRFVWIDRSGLKPEGDYSQYVKEQISRSGLQDRVAILDHRSDVSAAFASAHLFLLSSRLAALSNEAIDASVHRLPIVCFKDSGGIAELLETDVETRSCVVPYLDVAAAARMIAMLTQDSGTRDKIARATSRLASATFDMDRYVNRIDDLGRRAAAAMKQRIEDLATIEADPLFDSFNFLGEERAPTRAMAIQAFLAHSAVRDTGRMPTPYFFYRRPCPGFHPQIYAHENRGRYDTARVNPLAHFIRNGKPDGPWRHEVIEPSMPNDDNSGRSTLKAALHAHFFYPELCDDFVTRVNSNRSRCDLLLTTDERAKAETLREATAAYDRGSVTIQIIPNRGRDIAPFLSALQEDLSSYDVVGHLHGKRSLLAADPLVGELWREFLWQNLLGGVHSMMDIVLDRFASDQKIGLVFADDPHLASWDSNLEIASDLARRMGITRSLPPFFDFPIGTMFWARRNAMRPLVDLRFTREDYPEEPVPNDGTMLHAIERLLPFVAQQQGYRYATTHVPGVTW
jgi:glycosyltransferase involved in cell wall biosynthesis